MVCERLMRARRGSTLGRSGGWDVAGALSSFAGPCSRLDRSASRRAVRALMRVPHTCDLLRRRVCAELLLNRYESARLVCVV